jgi:hypothetical protein
MTTPLSATTASTPPDSSSFRASGVRLEALDIGAGLAQQLGHRFIARGAGLHADLELLQVGELRHLADSFTAMSCCASK